MTRSSPALELLRGRGMAIAFLDVLFSCIGIFITVIALQAAPKQESRPAIGASAYLGLLSTGTVLYATHTGVQEVAEGHLPSVIESILDAGASVYPRVEVLFPGGAIAKKRALHTEIETLARGVRPARLVETNWRPAASDEAVRGELERVAGALGPKTESKAER
jgi:hypothetical protein